MAQWWGLIIARHGHDVFFVAASTHGDIIARSITKKSVHRNQSTTHQIGTMMRPIEVLLLYHMIPEMNWHFIVLG